MSWKKNAFSYGIWFVYTIMTGLALLTLGTEICGMAGFGEYMGIVLALVWTAVAGGFAFLLHGFVVGRVSFFDEKRVHFTVLGTLLATALFGAGLFLRLRGMGDGAAYSSSIYYEAAKVTEGQGIPQSVHGAVYFYVLLLRGVFLLLGNNAVMGIWLQIVLQFGAALLLFLTVRKFAGMPAGLVTLGFCMCAPYSVRCCLELSPRMLYFFLVTAAVRYMTMGHSLAASFFAGVLAALCGYVDILGFVLLAVAIGRILCCREETWGRGRKAVGVLLCAAGAIQGFVACILLDAWFSGKPAGRVAAAWLSLYRPEKFALPVQADGSAFSAEACLLAGVMAFGIFRCQNHRQPPPDSRNRHPVPRGAAYSPILASHAFSAAAADSPGTSQSPAVLPACPPSKSPSPGSPPLSPALPPAALEALHAGTVPGQCLPSRHMSDTGKKMPVSPL